MIFVTFLVFFQRVCKSYFSNNPCILLCIESNSSVKLRITVFRVNHVKNSFSSFSVAEIWKIIVIVCSILKDEVSRKFNPLFPP